MIELWLMLDSSAMHVVKLSHITTWLAEGSLRKKICQVPSKIWKQALFVIWTVKTIKKYAALKATRNEETKVIKNGRKCSINWAGIAYTTLYFSKSGKSYKHHADINNCGGLVGTKNHIARFPYLFYHMYMMLLDLTSNCVLWNNLPFHIMADKMIRHLIQHMVGICIPIWNVADKMIRHLIRHMIGICIPIWDVRSSYLSKDIYVQCSPMTDGRCHKSFCGNAESILGRSIVSTTKFEWLCNGWAIHSLKRSRSS